jgi:hypothetical protein
MVQAQQALTQTRDEMVTMEKHQIIFKQLRSMEETKHETYAELTRAQEKTKKIQNQFEKALEKIKEICDVYSDAIICRAPATNYTLFLMEFYPLLRVKSIKAGKPITFTTVPKFISCFREQEEKVQYFLVGIFIMGRQKAEYLFVIDGKLSPMMMNKRKWQDQQCNDDRMARSEP